MINIRIRSSSELAPSDSQRWSMINSRVGAVVVDHQPVDADASRLSTVTAAVSGRASIRRRLDRILAHEVYGHAIPLLLAGSLAGNARIQRPGKRAS